MSGEALHGMVLILDDHYAVESDHFYSQSDFARDFASLPFKFVFSPAWDDDVGRYTVETAVRAVQEHKPDGILLDIMFGRDHADRLGISMLRELTACFPAIPVVMMTSVARDEIWADCARLGAVDYLPKPLDVRLLWQTLDRYVGAEPEHWLIGQNHLFLEALNLAAMAAEGGETSVMITGESGTGKELIARFLHRHGRRSDKSFETIYLPNIPGDMQAANLFGYRKGAFTGADRDEPGRFLAADGGVVFLDEIGDIDSDTQLRLLRVADMGEVSRLGDGKTRRVDVQTVTATNADLAQKIKGKEFRYDLWARLNGMPVNLPPLAQRRDDIPLLVRHLLRCQALRRGRPAPVLTVQVEAALGDASWEGSVRGLLSYAQRVFDLAGEAEPDEAVFLEALPRAPGAVSHLSEPLHPLEEGEGDIEFPSRPRASKSGDAAVAMGTSLHPTDRLQRLRLDELALLDDALQKTRDPVTGAIKRAKAAALLKGKPKCSTNEFDRWVQSLWNELTSESRELVEQRFPDLLLALRLSAKQG